jgi:sulfide:quinone oxidoreductase
MSHKVLILGAGFGGLELSSLLDNELGDEVEITLIDKNSGFVFGFSKFDLMLGQATLPEVVLSYSDMTKPGVNFRQETITAIDPANRAVTTDSNSYEADTVVVALGAEFDIAATPGFAESGHEFYSVPGAIAVKDVLADYKSGSLVIGILGQPFKCPPAPCEAAILLDEWFEQRGLRSDIDITLVSQWKVPIPPSPDGSKAIVEKFAERNINYITEQIITSLDPATSTANFKDGGSISYDLFLGIPVHRVPEVVRQSGLSENGWVPVDHTNLATKFPGVYAVGDVTSAPTPKAGVFAESAAAAVAEHLVAQIRGTGDPRPFDGQGACYVEFGDKMVGRMNANFFPGTKPTAPFTQPSREIAIEKADFVTERRRRWLGS